MDINGTGGLRTIGPWPPDFISGHLVTARIRRMGEVMFSISLSIHQWGIPWPLVPGPFWECTTWPLDPGSFQGVVLSMILSKVLSQFLGGGGVPPARTGVPPDQDGCVVRVVCLLRSRSRTFLFYIRLKWIDHPSSCYFLMKFCLHRQGNKPEE